MSKSTRFLPGILLVVTLGVAGWIGTNHKTHLTPVQQNEEAARQAAWMTRAVMPVARVLARPMQNSIDNNARRTQDFIARQQAAGAQRQAASSAATDAKYH